MSAARLHRPRSHLRPRGFRAPWFRLRRRPAIWWSATIALTCLSASMIGDAISRAEEGAARYGSARAVLVATAEIAPGDVLEARTTELREVPDALVARGAVGAEALGERVTHPIHAGEAVHAARLGPAGLSAVAALLPPGARGIAVPAGLDALPLAVGDEVDVLATTGSSVISDDELGGSTLPPTVTVAERALVVAVAESSVTVAVTAEEAARVAFAVTTGIVTLVLLAR